MTYIGLALVAVGLVVLARRGRKTQVFDAVLGFARSMDTTSMYVGSRRHPRR